MARIRLSPGVIEDFARIASHLRHHEIGNAGARSEEIIGALDVLAGNPLIGRPVHQDQRELVIGRDAHGYVALYRYIAAVDTVFVLAVRAQRESGYVRDE
jgi:plasmid stabilization system protein ParE